MPAVPDSEERSLRRGFGWLDTSVTVPAGRGDLLAVVAVAVGVDIAIRAGGIGLGGALLVAVAAIGLLATRPASSPQARTLIALAPVFGMWLFVRTSPWLLLPDLFVAGGLLMLGVTLGRRSLFDLTIPGALAGVVRLVANGVAAPSYLAAAVMSLRPRLSRTRRATTRALFRGILLAAPLLLVLAILLASADAVFASFLHVEVDPPSALTHAAALTLGAWAMGGLVRAAGGSPGAPLPRSPQLGWVEGMVVLVSMNGLFLAFAVAQVVALSDGGRRVIETAGLTYAQYARSGFFQLLWVASITLVTLLALRAVVDQTDRSLRRRFALLAEITVVLTLLIVFVAVRRLGLYADAFGLTMLRLYSTVFSYWIGAVFVLVGLLVAGIGRGRSWLPATAVAIGMAGLLCLNVVNPEAMVVRHNVSFAEETGRFDPAYVSDLSDDAIPTLVGSSDRLDEAVRRLVLARVCPPPVPEHRGWAAYNVARDRAFGSLAAACDDPG